MSEHPPTAASRGLLRPDIRVNHVLDIDVDALKERGVKGLIFDLDDTLVHAIEELAQPEVVAWIAGLREQFKVYIVSNNFSHNRVTIAAEHLAVPFVARARKPSRRFFRHALAEMGLKPHEAAIVGDQLFTDVLGGNRVGAVTILVDPLSQESKWHRKMMRSVERQMLRKHAYHPPRVRHASLGPTTPHHTPALDEPHPHHPAMDPGPHHHT